MMWIILLCILVIVIYALVAVEFYRIAVMKGHDEKKYFWLSFLLSFIGWMLVIALPDQNAPRIVVHDTVQPNNNTSDELPEL